MPLFHHSSDEDQTGERSATAPASNSDALLEHLSGLPMPQRAAEVLAGIASELPDGGRSAMYAISGDGKAALARGDVAQVIARRLPD